MIYGFKQHWPDFFKWTNATKRSCCEVVRGESSHTDAAGELTKKKKQQQKNKKKVFAATVILCDLINVTISSSVNSHYHPSFRAASRVTEVNTAAVKWGVNRLSRIQHKSVGCDAAPLHHCIVLVHRPGGCGELCLLPCSDSCFRAPYVDSDSAPRGEGPCTALKDTSLHQGHSQQKYSSFSFFSLKWWKAEWDDKLQYGCLIETIAAISQVTSC